MQVKKFIMAALLPATAVFGARAQQTVAESSLCDNATLSIEGDGENQTLQNLCDKNDMTVFETGNATAVSVVVDAGEPWVAKGVVTVAADDPAKTPVQMTLYGRNEGDSEWIRIGRFSRMKYSAPFTAHVGKTLASQTSAYTLFKIEFNEMAEGDELRLAEMQILGYRAADSNNIATDANGSFTAPAGTENLQAITGGNYNQTVSLRNVKAENGIENAWIDYTFDTPTALTGYAITANASSASTMRPATWDLLASEDGENWVTLDMRNNEASFNVDNYEQRYDLPSRGARIDFAAAADNIYDKMLANFYRDYWGGKYLVHSWNPDESKVNGGYNYWWMAHAIDAFTDAYKRTGKRIWTTRAAQIKQGMYVAYDAGRRDLWNSFYDDMEWMAIACIRAYENYPNAQNVWLAEAKQLFDWIWGGWNEVNDGGIGWNCNDGRDSKNSCSNAPAIIIAARLYQITGEDHYLTKAKMIHDWMLTHSRFDDGFIKDAPGNDNRGWTFSYNQGTWVGGLLELYKITGEEKYRTTATELMDKCLDGRWYSPKGIMREQGGGDGGLFKGIYIRYITEWVVSGKLDPERQYRYAKYLVENAKSLYIASLIKPDWKVMPCWQSREARFNNEDNGGTNGDYHASIMLSGLFLLEGVDLMKREGILNDDYSVKNPAIGKAYRHYRLRFTDNQGGANLQLGGVSLYGDNGGASVEGVAEPGREIAVTGGYGEIEVNGADGLQIAVVTPSGIIAATTASASASEHFQVRSGIYLVRVSDTVSKVLVK